MKKIFLIGFIIALYLNANAQIALEYKYDSASTLGNWCTYNAQLMIINFEVSGDQYVKINRCGQVMSIYDMNHSLLKNISLAGLPLVSGNIGTILYLSERLFNTDSKKEFMYVYSFVPTSGPTQYVTNIYNEDNILLFSDTGVGLVQSNVPLQQYPIYNTSVGTKMILSHSNGQAWVFDLPGTLTTAIQQASAQLMQAQGQLSNLYPNPSNGAVTLQYALPQGEHNGELILYNTQGAEVKRYKVDDTFTDVILDNTQLPAGTYFYQLTTNKGAVGVKKMVVVK